MAHITIEQLKKWVTHPQFQAELNPENKNLIFKIASTCNCNWGSVLTNLLSTQPQLLHNWANANGPPESPTTP